MKKTIEKTKVEKTLKIVLEAENDSLEQELREMDKEALLRRLNFEETNPNAIKLIKKIIKEKK